MPLIIASIIINGMVTAFVLTEFPIFGSILLIPLGLSVLGAALMVSGSKLWGSVLTMIGCFSFIPIGMIGAFGASKVRDQIAREKFEAQYGRSIKGDSPQKKVFRSLKSQLGHGILGAAVIIASLFASTTWAVGPVVGAGIVFIVFAIADRFTPMAQIYDDYVQLKMTPLVMSRYVAFDSMRSLNRTNERLLELEYESDGKLLNVKLLTKELEDDHGSFETFLEETIARQP